MAVRNLKLTVRNKSPPPPEKGESCFSILILQQFFSSVLILFPYEGDAVLYRLAILDDNSLQAEDLKQRILRHPQADDFEIATCSSAEELNSLRNVSGIDILFCDICLGQDDADGVSIVKESRLSEYGTQIVYVTGHSGMYGRVRNIVDSFFLMKPIRDDELFHIIDQAIYNAAKRCIGPLLIHSIQGDRIVKPTDILYVESWKRIVEFHLINGETVRSYMRLSDTVKMLPSSFVQCHKSFIVNVRHVVGLNSDTVHLSSGTLIPVARGRRHQVQDSFNNFWRNRLSQTMDK